MQPGKPYFWIWNLNSEQYNNQPWPRMFVFVFGQDPQKGQMWIAPSCNAGYEVSNIEENPGGIQLNIIYLIEMKIFIFLF